MVPVGWALQADGHEVRVLCATSQVESVSRAGLLPVPVLDGMDVVLFNRLLYYREAVSGNWPYPWMPLDPVTGEPLSALRDFDIAHYERTILPALARQSRESCDRAVEYARSWSANLILHDPLSLEGALAGRVVGVPAALALWGPVGTHEPDGPQLVPDDISDSFRRYGLGRFSPDLIEHVVDPCPAAVSPPTTAHRLPVRYVPYYGAGPVPPTVDVAAKGSRVCVSWSTALTTMSGPDSYALPKIVRGVSALDVEVVLTATGADLAALGPVPPSVRVLEHSPLRVLLQTCDVVVHHGGAGSTMTAMSAGVPQVLVSHTSEQARIGSRVAAAGIGRHLPGHLNGPDEIREAVVDLLTDPAYRRSAAQVCAEMQARPTPVELVATLDKLARD
jgi:hypothetical protein